MLNFVICSLHFESVMSSELPVMEFSDLFLSLPSSRTIVYRHSLKISLL